MLFIIKATMPVEETRLCLIRVKTNERFLIDKPIVRIGKEQEFVILFISGNVAISRNHAKIIVRNGKYYIVATNSVNHTYVNDEVIHSNVETMIDFGAKIRLANEEFVVYL